MKILILCAGAIGGYFGVSFTKRVQTSLAIATRNGTPANECFRAMLSAPGSMLTASMLRDLENGGPVEADHIEGYMLEKAQAHGVDDGMLVVAFAHLKAYEVRRGR